MRFLAPEWLWLLAVAPLLLALYVWALRRKRRAALPYSSLALVRAALTPGARWRRHVPPALFLCGLVAALLAAARPAATVTLPSDHMTIVMALDVSLSMRVNDITPTRFEAMKASAKTFINELPRNVRVGIVSFAGSAAVVQAPTDDREALIGAIDRFQMQRGTATGSGLILALSQLLPEGGVNLDAVKAANTAFQSGRYGWSGAPPTYYKDRATRDKAQAAESNATPLAVGSYNAGALILLSDGRRTTGPDPLEGAKLAADRGVRVYSVGFGTKEGPKMDGEPYAFYFKLDEESLKGVAAMTSGEYFHAASGADLTQVYRKLSAKFALEKKDTEVSALFAGGAAALILLGMLLSVLWFYRPAVAVGAPS
jgi:Ca-activated chloride channel homolog